MRTHTNIWLQTKVCFVLLSKETFALLFICTTFLSNIFEPESFCNHTSMQLVRGCLLVHVQPHVLCVIFIHFTKFLIVLHWVIHFIVKAELCLTTSCLKLCETFTIIKYLLLFQTVMSQVCQRTSTFH